MNFIGTSLHDIAHDQATYLYGGHIVFPEFLCQWFEGMVANDDSLTFYILTFEFLETKRKIYLDEYCGFKMRVAQHEHHRIPKGFRTLEGVYYRYRMIKEFLHEPKPRAITLTLLLTIYSQHSECPVSF